MENYRWIVAVLEDIEDLTTERGLLEVSASLRHTRRLAQGKLSRRENDIWPATHSVSSRLQ